MAENMSWTVPAWRAIWIPPDTDHQLEMLGKVEFHVAYIDSRRFPLPKGQCCTVELTLLARELIHTLAKCTRAGEREKLITKLLLQELQEAPRFINGITMPADKRLAVVCQALLEDPSCQWTLREWATKVGSSERTLARLCKQELAMSFNTWREQVRLAKLMEMLGRKRPLTEIAEELGYSHASALSAMVKRTLGVPPTHLKNQRINKN